MKYHIANSTTTNLRDHLARWHDFRVDDDKNSRSYCKKAKTESTRVPFNAYEKGYIDTTKGLIYVIIKDKISLNSVNAERFRYSYLKSHPR